MSSNINDFFEGKNGSRNLNVFRLMNTAMYMQLWHSIVNKRHDVFTQLNEDFSGFDIDFYRSQDARMGGNQLVAWRPFQLAFILLNLDGIFRPDGTTVWNKRNELVDLVWFPTGGGKTEAYLGLIALTIINRRRANQTEGGGTACIMRYTLRLLTLQQFQRATLLIMALELIRRWGSFNIGTEPIYIGLWVGDDSLPNSIEDLQIEFQKLSEGSNHKIPFDKCPWCNSKLSPASEVVTDETDTFHFGRLPLSCSNKLCSFYYSRPSHARTDQRPIPVSLCDDEIYQQPPALLFGTVDKFALLAHKVSDGKKKRNSDSRRLFGRGNWEAGKPKNGYLPPDLIIQDELHLLLGPLGSAVALFESIIDKLCTRSDGTRPKVISSTATTRNAQLQIAALFDRRVNIFPKMGVDCDDSFYAFYKRSFNSNESTQPEYESRRRYVGILPTGRTQIWMQMRLAAILLTHRALFEVGQLQNNGPLDFDSYSRFSKVLDYYQTVVSYFNSLKEVGKTESQINTYIIKEIRRVFNRVIRPGKLMHCLYTYYPLVKGELTGRLSGEDVKNELSRVSSQLEVSHRFSFQQDGKTFSGTTPPDFVVATNMISVGIDISRLNQIMVNSMPRNIAEYIQATSRVARDSSGLVLTIHHPFRARDVSHYERYVQFHEKMYSYVEPISITPFTPQVLQRYLPLYYATYLRHFTTFINREAAPEISRLSSDQLDLLVNEMSEYFGEREVRTKNLSDERNIQNLLTSQDVLHLKKLIKTALNDWVSLYDKTRLNQKTLVFNHAVAKAQQEQLYVDLDAYSDNIHSDLWKIPMSLRVVEQEAGIKIKQK